MKMIALKYALLIFLLFPMLLVGQHASGFLIKTLVFQNVLYQNPTIIIEKRMTTKFSIELLAAVRNCALILKGGEWPPIPNLKDCEGYTFGLSTRYYFPKNRTSPNTWYVSALLRYNHIYMKNVKYYVGISGNIHNVNVQRNTPEFGIVLGRQMLMSKHITTEFYFGIGNALQFYSEEAIPGIASVIKPDNKIVLLRPYLGWTMGYFIPNHKRAAAVESKP